MTVGGKIWDKVYNERKRVVAMVSKIDYVRAGKRIRSVRKEYFVAAMLVLVICSSITANAMGFELWEVIVKWTQETFHFGYVGEIEETNAPSPDYDNPCASLQEALDKYDIAVSIVPTWIPDGYQEGEIKSFQTPTQRQFVAQYQKGDDSIRIRITDYSDTHPVQVEQSDSLVEIYSLNNIDYYIFSNEDQLQAVWVIEHFECYISGPLTLTEIKEIINSI